MPRTNAKNPLHPSALRVGDLTIGRRVTVYDVHRGIIGTYTILKAPFVGYGGYRYLIRTDGSYPIYPGQPKDIVVLLRDSKGRSFAESLGNLGVTSYPSTVFMQETWSQTTYVVDHRKAHLLPAEPQRLPIQPSRQHAWLQPTKARRMYNN